MKGFIDEFKQFIMRGNVIDLAVAVVIGAEFSKIVSSLVEDIIMPIVGMTLGGVDFTTLAITIGDANISYGNFMQAVINFVLIAFAVFIMVKVINRVQSQFTDPEPEAAPQTPADIALLQDIRGLLQQQNNKL